MPAHTKHRLPKISIVTICKDHADFLEESMLSVLNQGYDNLEYIVIDAASTDGSVELIKKHEEYLHFWVSEPDEGPAQALNKGFSQATGEIMGWINADDKLQPGALKTIGTIFNDLPQVEWLTGQPSWFSKDGTTIMEMPMSDKMKAHAMSNQLLNHLWSRWSSKRYEFGDYHAIQQESTFWRRTLWDLAGGQIDQNFRYAFDMELWSRFFNHAELYTTRSVLGGFRVMENQISAQREKYEEECQIALRKNFKRNGKGAIQPLVKIISYLLKPFYYLQIPLFEKLYVQLMKLPPIVIYDTEHSKWELER